MIDLNKEAEDYIQKVDNQTGTMWSESTQEIVKVFVDFIENSKYVQSKIIQAQIEILDNFYYGEDLKDEDVLNHYVELLCSIKEDLEQELKQLEDVSSNNAV